MVAQLSPAPVNSSARPLLERIIQASSNEGDVVLDPFCGCGTTIAAAQKLNREWIGIDVTHLAVGLMKLRLKDSFGMVPMHKPAREQGRNTNVEGIALADARACAPDASVASYRVIGQPEERSRRKRLLSLAWLEQRLSTLADTNSRRFTKRQNRRSSAKPANLQTYKQAGKFVAEGKDQGMLGFD